MTADVIAIHTRHDALKHAEAWEAHAERMEMLYQLACIQRDAAERLLKIAEAELERMKHG